MSKISISYITKTVADELSGIFSEENKKFLNSDIRDTFHKILNKVIYEYLGVDESWGRFCIRRDSRMAKAIEPLIKASFEEWKKENMESFQMPKLTAKQKAEYKEYYLNCLYEEVNDAIRTHAIEAARKFVSNVNISGVIDKKVKDLLGIVEEEGNK